MRSNPSLSKRIASKSGFAAEVQRILKLPSHLATDAFLKQHDAYLHYTSADLVQDLDNLERVRERTMIVICDTKPLLPVIDWAN